MEKRMMTYNGHGGEVGMLTHSEACARYVDVEIDEETGTMSVGESLADYYVGIMPLSLSDGSDSLRVIVQAALDDGTLDAGTDDGEAVRIVTEIVREAEEEAAAEQAREVE